MATSSSVYKALVQYHIDNTPVITLSNGVRVANFNSPHSFNFEDGSILPAVSENIAIATQLDSNDVQIPNGKTIDVVKQFIMSPMCHGRLEHLRELDVDVILVPLPVLLAMREKQIPIANYRTIYVVDRISKAISITKFCR